MLLLRPAAPLRAVVLVSSPSLFHRRLPNTPPPPPPSLAIQTKKAAAEIFFRNARFYKGGLGSGGDSSGGGGGGGPREAPPVFMVDGVSYLHVKDGGVHLAACTRDNASPSFVLEFLKRVAVIIKVRGAYRGCDVCVCVCVCVMGVCGMLSAVCCCSVCCQRRRPCPLDINNAPHPPPPHQPQPPHQPTPTQPGLLRQPLRGGDPPQLCAHLRAARRGPGLRHAAGDEHRGAQGVRAQRADGRRAAGERARGWVLDWVQGHGHGHPPLTPINLLKLSALDSPNQMRHHHHPPNNQKVGLKPLFGLQKGPTGVFKSVLDTARTDGRRGADEVFVDVVERLAATFSPGGALVAAQIDGAVQVGVMLGVVQWWWWEGLAGARVCQRLAAHPLRNNQHKLQHQHSINPTQIRSYLAGNPPIKVKLNDGLLIARRDAPGGGGGAFGGFSAGDFAPEAGLVVLDDAYFHEAANLGECQRGGVVDDDEMKRNGTKRNETKRNEMK